MRCYAKVMHGTPIFSANFVMQNIFSRSNTYAMKNLAILLLLTGSLLFFSCSGCKDSPTVVNATVVDLYTNEPLSNVYVVVQFFDYNRGGYIHYTTLFTDVQGRFSFSEEEKPEFKITQLAKTGYVRKDNTIYDFFENYEEGKINEAVIPLIPEDGILVLKAKNIGAEYDSLYVRVFSPIWSSEFGISLGRAPLDSPIVILHPTETSLQYVPLASNQNITIYWDTVPINTATASRVSMDVLRHDTIYHYIEF
jgi:hypothetical protein